MKTRYYIITIILAACLTVKADRSYNSVTNIAIPTVIKTNVMAGAYYTGDGLGYNLLLTVNTNMTYSCIWRGCLGVYGTATGTWTTVTNQLKLTPSTETEMLKKKSLRSLDILLYRDAYIFVDPDWRSFFIQYGPDCRGSCFQKTEEKTSR
jgi:hypothetical protein